MEKKELIIDFCRRLGLDTIGFAHCRVFHELTPLYKKRKEKNLENEFEEKDIQKRINPFVYMSEGKTIIAIAFPYAFKGLSQKEIFFSTYTLGTDYHKVVGGYLQKICEFIESLGGKTTSLVDSNSLPERYIAYLSGIGFIGRNNMIITKKYGSYVFLGEIITDLELLTDEEKDKAYEDKVNKANRYEECKDCELCIKNCPTKAINMKEKNPNNCLSYITQKKHIEDKWFSLMGGRLFGCDSCQQCCPYNQEVEQCNIDEFTPREYMENINLEEIVNLNNGVFKDKYACTSCGWRGKNLLIRNAMIASFNKGKRIKLTEIKSSYVEDYYHRLLSDKDL
jgi:epoxyqueuosine reductase